MSKVFVTESYLDDIADAIRGKNGTENTYKPPQMAAAITALPDPAVLDDKTITANGTYDPSDDDLDGYSEVTVNVPNSYAAGDEGKVVSSGALVSQGSDTVTENDTYDTTLISSLTVNVSGGGGSTGLYIFEASGDDYETSSNSVTLDDSELYMFCTVYDGSSFSNASIIAGKTQPVYTTQGYGRVIAFIRPSSTNVSYGRFGSIDTNKYVGLNVKNGNEIVNDDVMMSLDSFTSTSGPFSAIEGKVYVFGTDANAFDGTFTGADVIASALLGDVDSKRTAFFIVKATATTVQYSKSGTHYYARLKICLDCI